MSDHLNPLLERVRADREDEAAWQVLGDALIERGDLRGEWIASTRQPPGPTCERRLQELRQAVIGQTGTSAVHLRWERGFAVEAWLGLGPGALDELAASLDVHPLLGSLVLDRNDLSPDDLDALTAVPGIERLTGLRLRHCRLHDPHQDALTRLLDRVRPRELDLHGNALELRVARLAHRGVLAAIESLQARVPGYELGTLLADPDFRPRTLALDVGVADMDALVASPILGRCRTLQLGLANPDGAEVTPERWARWLSPEAMRHLRDLRLALPGGPRGPSLAMAIRDAALPELESLDLHHAHFGDEGLVALAEAELPALARLHLSNSAIGEDGARALARARGMPRLRRLILGRGTSAPVRDVLDAATGFDPELVIEVAELDGEPPPTPYRAVRGPVELAAPIEPSAIRWAEQYYRLVGARSYYLAGAQLASAEMCRYCSASPVDVARFLGRMMQYELYGAWLQVVEDGSCVRDVDVRSCLRVGADGQPWQAFTSRPHGPGDLGWDRIHLDEGALIGRMPALQGVPLAPGEGTIFRGDPRPRQTASQRAMEPPEPARSLTEATTLAEVMPAVGFVVLPYGLEEHDHQSADTRWYP